MNSEKTLELLGYNEIKSKIKTYTSSNLGKRLTDEMLPNTNPKIILNKYQEVKEAVIVLREGTGISLGGINDITSYLKKIEKGMFLHPDELLNVADFLRCIRHVKKSIETYEYLAPKLYSYSLGMVHSRASNALEKIRKKMEALHSKRIDKLNKFLTSEKNAKYLQENYYSQRDNRYVVPIKASARKVVSGTVIDSSSSGSTVYIEIDAIKDLTVEIIMLKSQEDEECNQILWSLTGRINEELNAISDATYIIGRW